MRMIKDKITTVRINSEVLKLLEKKGWTVQRLVDEAIAKKIKIETKVKLR